MFGLFRKKKKITEEEKKEALERLSKAFKAGGYCGGALSLANGYSKIQNENLPKENSSQDEH